MNTPQESIDQAARDLLEVYDTKKPIAPLRETIPGMTLEDAYAIQTATRPHFPGALAGRKIGLTSKAMQKQLGVDSPDFGFFTAEMFHRDGAHLPAADYVAPKVEPEFAFLLKKDLAGPGITREDVADAIESVHAAIEIIDSRIENWNIRLVDTVADNASCGAVAVAQQPLDVDPRNLDDVACSLLINDEVVGSGTGADVLGDPLEPVAWLANLLGEQGEELEVGQWILPGSFCAAAPVEAGSTAVADFGPLGTLRISF